MAFDCLLYKISNFRRSTKYKCRWQLKNVLPKSAWGRNVKPNLPFLLAVLYLPKKALSSSSLLPTLWLTLILVATDAATDAAEFVFRLKEIEKHITK